MITIKAEDLIRAQELLQHIPGGVVKATARAINRAAESARTVASRKAREEYFVSAGAVRNTISIRKASAAALIAAMKSKGKLIPLAKFKTSPPTSGRPTAPVRAKIKRTGASGEGKGAFWATMKSGHQGIFGRLGPKRKPIQERMGPAVPQMLENETISSAIEERAQEVVAQRLDHEIGRLLAKGMGK